MRARTLGAWMAVAAVAVASCGADRLETSGSFGETWSESAALPLSLRQAPLSAIGGRVVFEASGAGSLRAAVPRKAKRRVLRSASVELPLHANAMVRVQDDTTHRSVGFALRGATAAPVAIADGIARYAGALEGGDLAFRVHAEGAEDFVVFETKPAREELVYDVDVSRVAGLRLVSNTLEFLDEGGAPRLRVAPPYVVDANGVRTEARLAVEGCAFDTDPSGPWGRVVTRAGAAQCGVRVGWSGVGYPLLVDPQWAATGSMATARYGHTATRLASGQVLVAGGYGPDLLPQKSAELFDGSASFAATGDMVTARYEHTATLLPSGKVLVAGGSDGVSALAGAELFVENQGFASTGPMAAARSSHTATLLLSSKVLVVGGSEGSALSSAELFDGDAAFAPTGSMVAARSSHTATLLPSGKVLIAGGLDGGALSSAEFFDGSASFAFAGSMAAARASHTATPLPSGKVLVAGGNNGAPGSSAELFDVGTGFTSTGAMVTPRYEHTATLLPSGHVLVVGGYGLGVLASAELFDGTATFAAFEAMTTGRSDCTATLLPSGQVLVAGGYDFSTGVLSSAELLDLPAGAPCLAAQDCPSGVCNENCCAGPCAGTCTTCDATGACLHVMNAEDPDTCASALNQSSCDASGVCKKRQGEPCAKAADCGSGFCADGVCCNTACGSACEVCSASVGTKLDGTCGPAQVGYPGKPACGMGGACNGTTVTYPVSCVADLDCLAAHYCGANGTCEPEKLQGASCNTAAGGDCLGAGCRECSTGFCADGICCDSVCGGQGDRCNKSTGKCVSGATCAEDGHTVVDAAGTPTDCAPYICAGGGCKTTCGSVDDCSSPNVCDSARHCAAAPPANGGDSGGCALASVPRGGLRLRLPLLLLALALAGLVGRRRASVN